MFSQICGVAMRTSLLFSACVFVSGVLQSHHGLVSAGECCLHGFGKPRESVSAVCRPDWGYSPTVWQRFGATSSSQGAFGNSDGSWGWPMNGAEYFSENPILAHEFAEPVISSKPTSIFPRQHQGSPRKDPHGGSQAPPVAPDSERQPPMALPQLPSSPQIPTSPQPAGQSRYQSPAYLPATAAVPRDPVQIHRASSGISASSAAYPATPASRYNVISASVIPTPMPGPASVPTADRTDRTVASGPGFAPSGSISGRYSSPARTSVQKLISTDKVMPVASPSSGGGRYGRR